jgi:hypothetical protein
MKRAFAIVLVLLAIAAGCSPEATRTRGGGPGADVGNRGPGLPELHGPVSNPSFETPKVGRAIEK